MSKYIVKADGHEDEPFEDINIAMARYWELVDEGVCVRLVSANLPPELEALEGALTEKSGVNKFN